MVSGSRRDISSHVDEWRSRHSQYRENTNEMQTTTSSTIE